MERRRRRYLAVGAVVLAVVFGVVWLLTHRPAPKPKGPHAVPVTVATVAVKDMPLTVAALGSAQAWTSEAIFAQVSGKLIKVNFQEGGEVRAGQVLAEVDPRPYEAALMQAEGTLKRDQAVLGGARRDLERYQRLLAQNAIARQTVEDETATVAQDEGVVLVDQGQVAAARLNLTFCRITSPITGRAGVRLVDPGNLVSASGSQASTPSTAAATNSSSGSGGGSSIVVINQIAPIAVTFTVPEGQFQRLLNASGGFAHPLAVQAYSQESGDLLDTGELAVADNRVDPATGTVELKARFPNGARKLWPGQFVNVKLAVETLHGAIVVPTAAINRGPNGPFVFVVGPDRKAVQRPVTPAGAEGDSAIVKGGLKAGERVVVDGQMSLKNGSPVRLGQSNGRGKASS